MKITVQFLTTNYKFINMVFKIYIRLLKSSFKKIIRPLKPHIILGGSLKISVFLIIITN